jgi:hypothetical protein
MCRLPELPGCCLPEEPIQYKYDFLYGIPTMMTSRKVVEYVTAEPFRPFRIRMASGQSFDIRHPEMILVGRTSVRIYTVVGDDTHEKWHDEPVDAAVAK